MVEKSSKEVLCNTGNLNSLQREELHEWIKPIQQALTIEAEKAFINLFGRQEHFHDFIVRMFTNSKSLPLSSDNKSRLLELGNDFRSYPDLPVYKRKRLVASSRQLLHSIVTFEKLQMIWRVLLSFF